MHWTVAGANAVIALRCCKLSGRYEDFWEIGRSADDVNLKNLTCTRLPQGTSNL